MLPATTIGKAECVQCGKERSAVRCEGCLKTFCYKHLADHRQELSQQLDDIETNRNLFRQTLNLNITSSSQQKHQLIQQIDDWKKESIRKIVRTADKCKTLVLKHITQPVEQVEIGLSTLTEDLRYIRRENDCNEADLMQLNARLEQLTKDLDQIGNIVIEGDSIPLVNNIAVAVSSSSK